MPNSPLTISMITQEALAILKNNLQFAKLVNRGYDDKYGQVGAKIGDTLSVRLPARYTVGDGAVAVAQDFTETSTQVVLNKQKHILLSFTSKELLLDIDAFSDRVLKPAVSQLSNQIDYDGLQCYKAVSATAGTVGTTPADLDVYLNAKAALANAGTPMDDQLSVVINPAMEAAIVFALKGLFQSSTQIAQQYIKGKMGTAAGFNWFMDQNCPAHLKGDFDTGGGDPTVKAVPAAGATTLSTQAWGAGATVKEGDVITVAAVNQVNPQNRMSVGNLQKFVVTADAAADGGGDMSISVWPPMTASGASQTIDAAPQIGAHLSVFGKETGDFGTIDAETHREGMAFHRDAFVLACADLPLNDVAHGSRVADDQFGLSVRIMRDYNILTDQNLWRLDVLYGWKCVRPELACRILSS